jgi:hypothetical protein
MGTQHQFFRNRAIHHYLQRKQKDVLPHLIAPLAFVFLWIALVLLLCVTAFVLLELTGLIGG